jgi:hypothetical protein
MTSLSVKARDAVVIDNLHAYEERPGPFHVKGDLRIDCPCIMSLYLNPKELADCMGFENAVVIDGPITATGEVWTGGNVMVHGFQDMKDVIKQYIEQYGEI